MCFLVLASDRLRNVRAVYFVLSESKINFTISLYLNTFGYMDTVVRVWAISRETPGSAIKGGLLGLGLFFACGVFHDLWSILLHTKFCPRSSSRCTMFQVLLHQACSAKSERMSSKIAGFDMSSAKAVANRLLSLSAEEVKAIIRDTSHRSLPSLYNDSPPISLDTPSSRVDARMPHMYTRRHRRRHRRRRRKFK